MPAAVTIPPPAARTGVPSGTAMSTPGCDSAASPGRTWPRVTKPATSSGQCEGCDGPGSYRGDAAGERARTATARSNSTPSFALVRSGGALTPSSWRRD